MSLAANALEEAGIATVIIGSALDIVEQCGVPRFCYTDFPLGNPCGPPWDRDAQAAIAAAACDLMQTATGPRTTRISDIPWPGENSWRQGYNYVGPENRAELQALGDLRRQQQAKNQLKKI